MTAATSAGVLGKMIHDGLSALQEADQYSACSSRYESLRGPETSMSVLSLSSEHVSAYTREMERRRERREVLLRDSILGGCH